MMEVLDNVLELHNAVLVDDAVKKLSWKYDFIQNQLNQTNTGMFCVVITN